MRKVVEVVAPAPDQPFIEIGPGRGALTLALAGRVARLLAIEIDGALVEGLRARAPAAVVLAQADILQVDLCAAAASLRRGAGLPPAAPVRVVGNLPYGVSAPILLRLLRGAAAAGLRDAVLMLQQEVAARVVAAAGSRAYGPLAIMTALHADAACAFTLPPGAFRPAPRVQSALVTLRFRPPARAPRDPARFEALVRRLFTRRRKQMPGALAGFGPAAGRPAAGLCRAAGLAPTRRPGDLGLPELLDLADLLADPPAAPAAAPPSGPGGCPPPDPAPPTTSR